MTIKHAGNELELMLARQKPLAMFYYRKSATESVTAQKDFQPLVEDGQVVADEFDAPVPDGGDPRYRLTYVLYALPDEVWRIPAMKVALTAQSENFHKPDEGIDRIIGLLLGYPKNEIDSWVMEGIKNGSYKAYRR
jgi:hypothetical protein